MLLSILTPLADLRPFTTRYSHRLSRPDWALPIPDDFVRSMGPVRSRTLGWGDSFLREGYFCDAAKTVSGLNASRRAGQLPALSTVYHRLYFDGLRSVVEDGSGTADQDLQVEGDTGGVTGKFETGLIFRSARLRKRANVDLGTIVHRAADAPIRFRRANRERPLVRVGRDLAAFLERQTTQLVKGAPAAAPTGLVMAGEPIALCHLKASDALPLPRSAVRLATPNAVRHRLYHWRCKVAGAGLSTWFIVDQPGGPASDTRLLRLYMMRMHVEHQVMRAVVRNLDHPAIIDADVAARDRLQLALRDGLRRIRHLSRDSSQTAGHEMGEVGRYAANMIAQADQLPLMERLESLRIRPNIERTVIKYIGDDARIETLNIRQLNVTQNTNNNYGVQGAVQQAGAAATQTAGVHQISENAGLREHLASLTVLLSQAVSEMSAQDAGAANKSLSHLKTELETEGASPDKGIVLASLESLGSLAKAAGAYAEPIGQVLSAIRDLVGL